MMWVFAIIVVLVMGGVAMVAAGKGQPMADAHDDRPDALVPPTGDLVGRDLRRVRFSLAFRGYRMSEVDALLDRLAAQLEPTPAPTARETPDEPSEATHSTDADTSAEPEPRGDGHCA